MRVATNWLRRAHRREEGNFLILSVFCILLLALIFVFIQDALRKSNYEEALQKLTDDAALYAAAYVPSVSVGSYIQSTGELRPWMQEQNYAVGYHILSAANATYIDQYATAAVRDFVNKNALNNQASNFFGGELEVTRVSPKFVARQEGDKRVIEYYVDVEMTTRWGSSVMSRSENLVSNAIAKAVIEYRSQYTLSESDYENPDPIEMFAKGVYARQQVEFNNAGDVLIIGDVHSDEADIKLNNNDSFQLYGDLEGSTGISRDGDEVITGTERTGADVPRIGAAMPPFPTGVDDPNYPHPIVIVDNDYHLTGTFPPAGLLDSEGNQAVNGTLYVRGGDLHLNNSGVDPNITGNWCFVTDGGLHFNNLSLNVVGDTSNDVFFMVGEELHLNNIQGPITIWGGIYCAGGIHINNTNKSDYPMTIYGGIYAGDDIKFNNNQTGVIIISEPMPDAMPKPWITYPVTSSSPPIYSSPRVFLIH